MKRVVILGGTGFIGKALCRHLVENGYEVVVLSRSQRKGNEVFGYKITVAEWNGKNAVGWGGLADGAFAVINLAGENIGAGRWSAERKEAMLQSRLNAGRAVVEAVKVARQKPKVLIQASAIGYYGSRDDEEIDESSSPGQGFLPRLAQRWELSTQEVESMGVRRVIIRSGLVLGTQGGVLPEFLRPFRFFIGGPLGNGEQWVSWIHLKDEVYAIRFLMEKENLSGAFNLAAPNPLRMGDFCRALGKAMKRPSWFPVPSFVLRLLFGRKAKETLLVSQKVLPKRLHDAGYKFLFPEIAPALKDLLK